MATRTRTRHPTNRPKPDLPSTGSFAESFPHSTKVYVEGARGVRVPMREISLSGGEPPLRVYDTSGPQGVDVREGLPALREEWIARRAVTLTDPERSEGSSASSPKLSLEVQEEAE